MFSGFGGIISFFVKGEADFARNVANSTKIIQQATSLGGVKSLIEHRASVEGPGTLTPKNLLRLSIGIEDKPDLIDDLKFALEE